MPLLGNRDERRRPSPNWLSNGPRKVSVHLYGQEVNPETYAISKADLILRGDGFEADNMQYGSTLSADALPGRKFDFILSNPPYWKSWKADMERLGDRSGVKDHRFIADYARARLLSHHQVQRRPALFLAS